ncbi:hypothetical protein CK934_02285 [Chitinophaga sp. MD30]|nr:hypothetical protein CK934_02285 [Chitinophaga sp. MD30]
MHLFMQCKAAPGRSALRSDTILHYPFRIKMLRIMKLTTLLLLCGLLQVGARGFSQQITISRKNISLSRVFAIIQQQSGYSMLYDNKLIKEAGHIDIAVTNASVETVLNKCLEGLPLTYTITDRIIVIRKQPALLSIPVLRQQISGQVTDEGGHPIPGVTVYVKELKKGTQTNADGNFMLTDIASGSYTLTFSFIGYDAQERPVTVGAAPVTLTVVMKQGVNKLQEMVVTALGIKKASKAVTYNVQTVSGGELNNVKDPSLVNTLSGKVAGLVINNSSSGPGGATKAVMRGNKSIFGNNNALYVIDGIPLPNLSTQNNPDGFAVSGGSDGISNINPDDIESVTALTGASAAALYGSQAANGVILLTTKKGRAGKTSVNYSMNMNFSTPLLLPEFQTTYGTTPTPSGQAPSFQSWGPKQSSNFSAKDFFQTGASYTHAINVSTGTEKNQTYFSAAAVNAKGIIPKNTFDRYNLNVRNSSSLFDDKLTLDVSAQYISQTQDNIPGQGQYFNPLVGLYLFPRSDDFNQYKTFEKYDPNRNLNLQNWPYGDLGMMLQNPYWIVNRNTYSLKRNRFIGSVAAQYNITDWLKVTGRIRQDRTNEIEDGRNYASNVATFLSGTNGRYNYTQRAIKQTYGDLLFGLDKKWSDFSLQANLGASIQDVLVEGNGWTNGYLLNYANMFTMSNIDFTRWSPVQQYDRSQTQAIFATAQLGFKELLYLEGTARQEWASPLAFTSNKRFFYPSVGLTGIISEMVQLPKAISFAKVRASYSEVGNAIPPYISNPTIPIPNGGAIQPIHAKPFTDMKPERTSSVEAGLDLRFLDNKLSLSGTFYNTHTKNQFFKVDVSPSVGYSSYYINAGNVQNKGIEASAGYHATFGKVSWNPTLTFALNRSKIVEMMTYTDPATGTLRTQDEFKISDFGGYQLWVKKGGAFGDIYAKDIKRDASGKIALNDKGLPEVGDYIKVGNANPRYQLGWNNGITFKNFQLNFLIDARIGGEVVSTTEAIMDNFGVSKRSAEARDNGGVVVNGTKVDAKSYYQNLTGATSSALALYTYSATNVRLREISLGYTLPGSLFNNKIQQIQLSVVGRNVWMIYKKAPYDPEITAFTTNAFQGYDYFGMPSQRNIGVNLRVSF